MGLVAYNHRIGSIYYRLCTRYSPGPLGDYIIPTTYCQNHPMSAPGFPPFLSGWEKKSPFGTPARHIAHPPWLWHVRRISWMKRHITGHGLIPMHLWRGHMNLPSQKKRPQTRRIARYRKIPTKYAEKLKTPETNDKPIQKVYKFQISINRKMHTIYWSSIWKLTCYRHRDDILSSLDLLKNQTKPHPFPCSQQCTQRIIRGLVSG